MKIAVVIPSDRAASGERADATGPALSTAIEAFGAESLPVEVMPDDLDRIRDTLIRIADAGEADVVFVAGGTGFARRDVTPEATRAAIERPAPGIAEAIRARSLTITPHAMLSRAVAGIRKRTLIINTPGSPKAAVESFEVVKPALQHAVELLRGESPH
jgi:molybdenum cofactor synthesis domain-containing protein